MKKLFSLILIASLLLGNTPMHAGNKLKKTWAYTKIGFGALNLIAALYNPLGAIKDSAAILRKHKQYKDAWQKIKNKEFSVEGETISLTGEPADNQAINTFSFEDLIKFGMEKEANHWQLSCFIYFLPLGILSIKSGKRDLRKIRKLEQQGKIA